MRWIFLLGLAVLAGGVWSLTVIRTESGDPVFCTECWFGGHHHHASEARRPSTYLKTLWFAQADYRSNDRDGDGKNEFWRADIAGLYAHAPGGGPAIKLIELTLAAADDRSLPHLQEYAVKAAAWGYWYRSIRHADEDPKALDPNRFAYCAYPDSASAGKYIYICDQDQRIYRCLSNGRRGIEVFPSEEELRTQWTRVG